MKRYGKEQDKKSIANVGHRRWQWIGHTLIKDHTSITKRALEWNPQGTRKRGRLWGTWRGMKDKDLDRSGKLWNDIKLAQDREG